MDTEFDQTKANFLARMSHEMRTPLNAIIGMCTIAQTTNDIKKMGSCLNKINEASLHLLGMINDVLDMAKIESGKLKLSNAEFAFRHMLKKTIGTKKFTLDAKKQELILDFDPDLPETIVADEQRLAQVLDNLLYNAIKFTHPEGNITLSVKKIKEDDLNCTLGFTVSDTGIGISEEGLKIIFSQFEQVDGGLTRKYAGTGMGLTISANIVRLMGGEIRVSSELGKGSSFSFEISVEKKTGNTRERSLPREVLAEKPKYSGFSILLVEDVEINRDIVISQLEGSGLEIDCAENGLEALQMYKASPSKYGLILMDVHMPKMDGFEAARCIRALEAESEKTQHEFAQQGSGFTKNEEKVLENAKHSPLLSVRPEGVPIIAMTANVFKDDIEKCLESGMTDHMGKPVNYGELIKHLEKFLKNK